MKAWQFLASFFLSIGLVIVLMLVLCTEVVSEPIPAAARSPAAELHVCASCAHTTIQSAVDAAQASDVIKVAAGLYTDLHHQASVTQVVWISKSVTIRGGYTDANWTIYDPDANQTVLNAQGLGRVIYVAGPGIEVTIEGLHITGGNATSTAMDSGGGIYVDQATISLSDNQIYSNTAEAYGGGIYIFQSTAMLDDNVVRDNEVLASDYYHGGGAIYLGASDATLTGNDVLDNTSNERVGGIYLMNGDTTLVDNTIRGNQGLGREGGGLHLRNGTATLVGNTFTDNTGHWGGGVYADMGTITLTQNTFVSNTATVYSGGAVSFLASTGTLNDNLIVDNVAASRGGGVHFYHTDATLHGNRIVSNTASSADGGGLFTMAPSNYVVSLESDVFSGNRAAGNGDCLSNWSTTLRVYHATLTRNGSAGNCIHVDGGSVGITNTLIYSHVVGIYNEGGTVAMAHAMWAGVVTPIQGTVDDTGSFTGTAAFAADGYHITTASDALNAGMEIGGGRDVDGEPRLSPPDIGADEIVTASLYLPLVSK